MWTRDVIGLVFFPLPQMCFSDGASPLYVVVIVAQGEIGGLGISAGRVWEKIWDNRGC